MLFRSGWKPQVQVARPPLAAFTWRPLHLIPDDLPEPRFPELVTVSHRLRRRGGATRPRRLTPQVRLHLRPAGLSAGGPVPGMSLQDLVLRAALIYDSGLPPPAGRGPITKNA